MGLATSAYAAASMISAARDVDKMKAKKGIFFTFLAIIIMSIFIILYTPQADITLQKDTKSIRVRIDNIDNYVNDLKNDYFEKVLKATTSKTVLSMILYMNATGKYIKESDFNSVFSEIMINGTINNVPVDSITGKKIMENNTLINWNDRVASSAKDAHNVNTTIIIRNVSISQSKPWTLDSKMMLNLSITSNVANWLEEDMTVSTTTSIGGFPDPYYLLNSNGMYQNEIKESSVEFNQWNISIVREHIRNGTYVHWSMSDAPSFLMRFTNTTTNSSCCGIESIVNPNKIIPNDQRESYVDYLFWTHTYNPIANCTQIYNITHPPTSIGLWDEFTFVKLDLNHLIIYNITSQDSKRNC